MALHLHVANIIRLTDVGQGPHIQRESLRPGGSASLLEREALAHEQRAGLMLQRSAAGGSEMGFWARMGRGLEGLGTDGRTTGPKDGDLRTPPRSSSPWMLQEDLAADAFAEHIKARRKKGTGTGLDESVKQRLEAFLGTSIDGVRIHTGREAERLTRLAEAEAFTVGREIYFGEGKFSPETPEGMALLAHELTHVLQQEGGLDWGLETPTAARMESAALEAERRFLQEGPRTLSGPAEGKPQAPSLVLRNPEPKAPPPREPAAPPTPVQSSRGARPGAALYHSDPGGTPFLDAVARAYGSAIPTHDFIQELSDRIYELMQEDTQISVDRRETGVW